MPEMTNERAKELGLWCVAWGAPGPGPDHMDCPVVVTSDSQVATDQRGKNKLPVVCECDCTTCKRAWWNAGRPIMGEDGVIKTVAGTPWRKA